VGSACPGQVMTFRLDPISEGGPGVRGQRPRNEPLVYRETAVSQGWLSTWTH
jgi:hypothetical protein